MLISTDDLALFLVQTIVVARIGCFVVILKSKVTARTSRTPVPISLLILGHLRAPESIDASAIALLSESGAVWFSNLSEVNGLVIGYLLSFRSSITTVNMISDILIVRRNTSAATARFLLRGNTNDVSSGWLGRLELIFFVVTLTRLRRGYLFSRNLFCIIVGLNYLCDHDRLFNNGNFFERRFDSGFLDDSRLGW